MTSEYPLIIVSAASSRISGLKETISSIRCQSSFDWQLLVVLDDLPNPEERLELTRRNPRIDVIPSDLIASHLASASMVVEVACGAILHPDAIREISRTFEDPKIRLIYGDSHESRRARWSPYLAESFSYLGSVVGFRVNREFSPPHRSQVTNLEFALVTDESNVLVSPETWRKYVSLRPSSKHVSHTQPRIAVAIPTCGTTNPFSGRSYVCELLESMRDSHPYPDQVLIVVDKSTPKLVIKEILTYRNTSIIPYGEKFNFARKCNLASLSTEAEILCFLNDDMRCLTKDWLKPLAEILSHRDVGAVGGLLLDESGVVQCAGHSNSPVPHLFGVGLDPADPLNRIVLAVRRECGGLSGACFGIRREVYLSMGGMCERLPNSYNDVDLGFKLIDAGYSLVLEPKIRFLHFESSSRDPSVDDAESSFLRRRWGRYLERDPFPPPFPATQPGYS